MAHTFMVHDVDLSEVNLPTSSLKALLEDSGRIPGKIEAVADLSVARTLKRSFIDAVGTAYNLHYPLSISPDAVWLTIALGLKNHIDQDPDGLRHHFVRHVGKQELIVYRDGWRKGDPSNDWPGVFGELSLQMKEFIGKKYDLIVSNFSTTTPIDKTSSEVTLLSAMQYYFYYTMITACGFPRITIEGTPLDWANIGIRVHALSEFGLKWWTDPLGEVIGQFVKAASGSPDIAFWQSFYMEGGASGGPYISGWINSLYPYLGRGRGSVMRKNDHIAFLGTRKRRGMGGPPVTDFPDGIVTAPLTWKYYGTNIPMQLVGGLLGVTQSGDGTLRPTSGWAVVEGSKE